MPVRPNKPEWKRWKATQPVSTPPAAPELTAATLLKRPHFIEACEKEGVKPTKRQARKYLAQTGRWASHFNTRIVQPNVA